MRAMQDALARYRTGNTDLHNAARQAGLEDWEFLEAAQATPDPVGVDKGLRPFVRER